jgi:hypothetical protein
MPMKTKAAKAKKSDKQKPAATSQDTSAHQRPRKGESNDEALDQTPEPPQMMHPLSDEERERKRDESQS